MSTSPIVHISRGVAEVKWTFTTTAAAVIGDSNILSLGNYDRMTAMISGPTGGTSAVALLGGPAVTGPFTVLNSVTGVALTITSAIAGLNYDVAEHPQFIHSRASTVTSAPTAADGLVVHVQTYTNVG
jgi:hypothetical protein